VSEERAGAHGSQGQDDPVTVHAAQELLNAVAAGTKPELPKKDGGDSAARRPKQRH